MNLIDYIYITLGVCIVFWLIIIALLIIFYKKNKIAFEKRRNKLKNKNQKSNKEKIVKQDTQIEQPLIIENKNLNLNLENNFNTLDDIPSQPVMPLSPKETKCLQHDLNYVVGSKGSIKEGKYMISSADENFSTFEIQLGDFVKSYKNGDFIVLKIGESIKPITCSVNLLSF